MDQHFTDLTLGSALTTSAQQASTFLAHSANIELALRKRLYPHTAICMKLTKQGFSRSESTVWDLSSRFSGRISAGSVYHCWLRSKLLAAAAHAAFRRPGPSPPQTQISYTAGLIETGPRGSAAVCNLSRQKLLECLKPPRSGQTVGGARELDVLTIVRPLIAFRRVSVYKDDTPKALSRPSTWASEG